MGSRLMFAPKLIAFLISVGFQWLVNLFRGLLCAPLCSFRCQANDSQCPAIENTKDAASQYSTSFACVHKRLYIALLDEKQARTVSRNILNTNYIVVPLSISKVDNLNGVDQDTSADLDTHCSPPVYQAFLPPCLGDIFKFHEVLTTLDRKYPRKKLVFQTGADHAVQARMVFLLGCHMIMSHNFCFEKTCTAFKDLRALFEEPTVANAVSIKSCWRAICCAKRMQWIDFERGVNADPNEDRCIHIDEYMHYARCAPQLAFGWARRLGWARSLLPFSASISLDVRTACS
jgi:hypothetical protein